MEVVNEIHSYYKERYTYRKEDKDFWDTPEEFEDKGYGDCEDFAIAMWNEARMCGFDDDDLRLVAVKDKRNKEGHMVLAIRISNKKTVILDQRLNKVADIKMLSHYRTLYWLRQTGWGRNNPRKNKDE